ncbi:MAG: hypothetical protein ABGY11_13110 [Candidatus Thioglobus sp.]
MLIKAGYKQLSLIHFFTAGEDEVRCWTLALTTAVDIGGSAITSYDF